MRGLASCLILAIGTIALLLLNLVFGSVDIPFGEVMTVLMGHDASRESWTFIILNSRLPQAVTALLAGAGLAASGLLMQTAFNNPLAGPSVLGITSGASLGAALVILTLSGGILPLLSMALTSSGVYIATIIGSFLGAMAVMALLIMMSSIVRSNVMLLIVGIMISYLTSSLVSLLYIFASANDVQSYVMWGMGTFSDVTLDMLPLFSIVSGVGIIIALLQVKPLNALLLGEAYATNLGFSIRSTRLALLLSTGLLTAIVTAFCGPIAFIGLAVPHVARLVCATSRHQILLPATLLSGSVIALTCNLLCTLPATLVIPINAITPLFGVPVILYVILRK